MGTVTRARGRVKPERSIQLHQAAVDGECSSTVTIQVGRDGLKTTVIVRYFLVPLPSDYGTAYRLEKFDASQGDDERDHYDVLLAADGFDLCECRGFLRHQHCKHIEGLRALQARGLLRREA